VIILEKECNEFRKWHIESEIDHTPGFKTFH